MEVSDIAYLKQINSGLTAVGDANKKLLNGFFTEHIDTFKELIKSKKKGVDFAKLNTMQPHQAIRLKDSKIIIYKDDANMLIPLEIAKKSDIKVTEAMQHDEKFNDAILYKPKTKTDLIKGIKEIFKSTAGLAKELKSHELSMTKIFQLQSLEEQNEILKRFDFYALDNMLKHFNITTTIDYKNTQEPYTQKWLTDPLTRQIQKEYEGIKRHLLAGTASASEMFAMTKKLSKEIEKIEESYDLDALYKNDPEASKFFTPSSKELLTPKEPVQERNFNSLYHTLDIDKKIAKEIIKENNLENTYPITVKESIKLFQPAASGENLAFVLSEYINYQKTMKNDYKVMKESQERLKEEERSKPYQPSLLAQMGA